MLTALFAVLAVLPATLSAPFEKRYTGVTIRSYRTGTCLTLQGGVQIINGSLLKVGDCSSATLWNINPGSGSVIVSGTNFALDAGTNPHNNVPAKVWASYPGLFQQTWYLTTDNRIAITGGNQCLDEGPTGPQTYQCTTGNTNQIWYIGGVTPPPSSSSSAPPPPPTGGIMRQLKQGNNQCATLIGTPSNGAPVTMQPCVGANNALTAAQMWTLNQNGQIQTTVKGSNGMAANFCIDAGINPSNFVLMKVWTCYPGLSQQTWNFRSFGGTGMISTANNQCLDVQKENINKLQTYVCSTNGDPQQQWVTSS